MSVIKAIHQKRWLLTVIAGMLIAGVVAVFLIQSAKAVYVTTSPNSDNMVSVTGGGTVLNPPNSTELWHILKNEDSSDVFRVEVEAYFDAASTARRIIIKDRLMSVDRCRTLGSVAPFITVTLTTQTSGTSTASYGVPVSRVCGNYAQNTTSTPGSNNNYFFSQFPVPAGFNAAQAVRDFDTNLFKVSVVISYNASVPDGDTSDDTRRQQVLFRVGTDTCANPNTCDRYISAKPAFSGGVVQRNISTLGRRDIGNYYVNQTFPFGLPCSEASNRSVSLAVYDVDNNTLPNNNVSFWLEKYENGAWTRLTQAEYGTGIVNGTWQGNRVRPSDGSALTTTVTFTMDARTRYRVTVGTVSNNNLIGLGLPTETIFGDIDCNVTLNGSISTNPATGVDPIEVGRTMDLSALATRRGNTAFDSRYQSLFRVWYDTGNGTYQASENLACSPITRTVTQSGASDEALGTCSDVLSDPTRSGGAASAICAQLILTPLEGLTDIQTGRAPNGLTQCYQIGKRPHMAALNGDVFSGGVLGSTPCTLTQSPFVSGNRVNIGGTNYGSYSTYGVTSLGVSRDFGSNGLKAGDPTSSSLVYGNRLENSVHGYFYNQNNSTAIPTSARCLTDPFTELGVKATTAGGTVTNIDLSTLVSPGNTVGRYYTTSGTLNITASSPIPANAKIIIYARNANIQVNSNIRYAPGPYGSISQLPQVALLTNQNLIVNQNVTQIDGVLAARNDVVTCEVTPRLNRCQDELAINGVVIAGHLFRPYRTHGAERPDYGEVAETIRLRPDTLLSQLPDADDSDVYMRTMTEREVPPRF